MFGLILRVFGLGKPLGLLIGMLQVLLLFAALIAAVMLFGFDPLGFVWGLLEELIRSAVGV